MSERFTLRVDGQSAKQVIAFVEGLCVAQGLGTVSKEQNSLSAVRKGVFGSDMVCAVATEDGSGVVLLLDFAGRRGHAVVGDVVLNYRTHDVQEFAPDAGSPITKWPDTLSIASVNLTACLFDASVDGDCVEVVGESNYQDALLEVAGGKTEHGPVNVEHTAILLPEPANRFDPNAVRVVILPGGLVGYLCREDAVDYRAVIDRLASIGQVVACHAQLTGGWLRGDDEGSFGAELQLGSPNDLMSELDEMASDA